MKINLINQQKKIKPMSKRNNNRSTNSFHLLRMFINLISFLKIMKTKTKPRQIQLIRPMISKNSNMIKVKIKNLSFNFQGILAKLNMKTKKTSQKKNLSLIIHSIKILIQFQTSYYKIHNIIAFPNYLNQMTNLINRLRQIKYKMKI